MKVFISWSGPASRALAEIVKAWLPGVIQEIDCWLSADDIEKGQRWREVLSAELEAHSEGIVCVTSTNLTSQWLNFEAGAIAKSREDSRARTLLLDLEKSDVTGPLSDFQHTVVTDRHDVFSFVESLNARCDRPLAADILYTSFGRSWSDFKTAIESIKDDADGAEIPKRSVEDKIEEVLDRVRNIEATMASVPQLAVSPSMLQQAARDRLRSNRDRSKPLVDALVTYINKEGHGVVRAIPHDDGERVEIVFPDGISDEELGKIGTMVGEAFPSRYFTVWLTTENQDRVVQVFPNEMGV